MTEDKGEKVNTAIVTTKSDFAMTWKKKEGVSQIFFATVLDLFVLRCARTRSISYFQSFDSFAIVLGLAVGGLDQRASSSGAMSGFGVQVVDE
jgi:hypothetical protein